MTLFLGILGSVIAAVVVSGCIYLYSRWHSRYRQLANYRATIDRMKDAGIYEVFFARSQYPSACDPDRANILHYLLSTQKQLRYTGLWMAQTSEHHQLDEVIVQLLNRGCSIEFCVMDPDMSTENIKAVASALRASDDEVCNRAAAAYGKLLSLRASLGQDQARHFVISKHKVPMLSSLIEFDWGTEQSRLWYDIKLPGRGRSESMSMEIREVPGGVAGHVRASFAKIREDAQPVE